VPKDVDQLLRAQGHTVTGRTRDDTTSIDQACPSRAPNAVM
jgi:hypothetical protein